MTSGNSASQLFDQTQPWSQGAIKGAWLAEGEPFPESKQKLTKVKWELKKHGVLVPATNEALDDATQLENFIRTTVPDAIAYELDRSLIDGDGIKEPEGILRSGFLKTIEKENGQAKNTINYLNVIKMYNSIFRKAKKGLIWVCHQECLDQLRTIQNPNGQYLWLAPGSQMNQTPYPTFMGLPLMEMLSAVSQLGTRGDILLMNPNWYYRLNKRENPEVEAAFSMEVDFKSDQGIFRFKIRTDGRCPFKAPVKADKGDFTVSAFTTLATRG